MVEKNLDNSNFIANGKVYLVKCPSKECGRENYAINVSTGFCTFCGLDGNEYYKDEL